MLVRTVLLGATAFLFATPALAAPDLAVDIVSPRPAYVYDYAVYDVSVLNLGNDKALDVDLVIELPETQTPQAQVMGYVIDIDYRCTQVGTQLECNLGMVPPGSTTVTFQLALPWSSLVLDVTATATTSSTEITLANNSDTEAGTLDYYAVQVQPGHHPTNACLPVWPLFYSSYLECTITPGLALSGAIDFDAGGNVWLADVPGVFGSWWQPTSEQLVYTYDHGSAIHGVETFEGWGVSSNCFEGFSSYSMSGVTHPREICF